MWNASSLSVLQKNDKQMPLVFVLMSRRQDKDYHAVFKALRLLVPINLQMRIVSDL